VTLSAKKGTREAISVAPRHARCPQDAGAAATPFAASKASAASVEVMPVERSPWASVRVGLTVSATLFLGSLVCLYELGGLTASSDGRPVADSRSLWMSAITAVFASFAGGWVTMASAATRKAGSRSLRRFVALVFVAAVIMALLAVRFSTDAAEEPIQSARLMAAARSRTGAAYRNLRPSTDGADAVPSLPDRRNSAQ